MFLKRNGFGAKSGVHALLFRKLGWFAPFSLLLGALLTGCSTADPVVAKATEYASIHESVSIPKTGAIRVTKQIQVRYDSGAFVELIPVNSVEHHYQALSAVMTKLDGTQLPLATRFKKFAARGLDNAPFTVITPRIVLPENYAGELVEIKVDLSFENSRSKGNSYAVALPVDAPVRRATVSVFSEENATQYEAIGFDVEGGSTLGNRTERRYVSKNPTDTFETITGRPILWISTFPDFASFAEASDAAAYLQELDANVEIGEAVKTVPLPILAIENEAERNKMIAWHLFKWVRIHFRYEAQGLEPGHGSAPRPLIGTWARRTGDCKDLSTMYMKLLKHFHIEAEPVLVATIDDGPMSFFPNKLPFPVKGAFNHVIVYLSDYDIYVDLVGFPDVDFGSWSARYAGTNAFHLFSQKMKTIMPGAEMRRVKTETRIYKQGEQWLGETNWSGQGMGQLDITSRGGRLVNKSETNSRIFDHMGFVLQPDSVTTHNDEILGKAETRFAYKIRHMPVDSDGRLIELPKNISVPLQPLYNFSSRAMLPNLGRCFARESFEDDFVIESIILNGVPENVAERHLTIAGREFTQRIEFAAKHLRIHRALIVNEQRAQCSSEAISAQEAFYKEVNLVIAKTNAQLYLAGAYFPKE